MLKFIKLLCPGSLLHLAEKRALVGLFLRTCAVVIYIKLARALDILLIGLSFLRLKLVRILLVIFIASLTITDVWIWKAIRAERDITQSLVKLDTPTSMASGVIIKSDASGSWIITNKHVCRRVIFDHEVAQYMAGSSFKGIVNTVPVLEKGVVDHEGSAAQVIKVHQNTDLCLLFTPRPNLRAARLATKEPAEGAKVIMFANPHGVEGVLSLGYYHYVNWMTFMLVQESDVDAKPGVSGSGLFNIHGELVGIVFGGDHMDNAVFKATAFSIPLPIIKAFVADLEL